jgi:hypothetical protein
LWHKKALIARLAVTRRTIKITAKEAMNRKDVVSFCNNIIAAHRSNAFGGKDALWDFMKDVSISLNRKKQGYKFSNNSKCFAQALIYGGRRMCDLFALNFVGPSYCTVKRENKKSVQFISGEHIEIFKCIAGHIREGKNNSRD